MKKLLAVCLTAPLVVLAAASPAAADHNSNNRATFTQAAAGTAIANYSEGTGTFNAGISARDLEPGTYTYRVNGPAGPQPICDFVVGASGNGSCSENRLELGGFTRAEIVTGESVLVAAAPFTRQGKSECRDPNQGGTESAECPNRTV